MNNRRGSWTSSVTQHQSINQVFAFAFILHYVCPWTKEGITWWYNGALCKVWYAGSSGVSAEQSHSFRVPSKLLDVFFNPTQSGDLVQKSKVADHSAASAISVEETWNPKTFLLLSTSHHYLYTRLIFF